MQGILAVISGFSGVGKGTLVKMLMERYPEDYALSISATSRSPRPGETEGKEYFFRTREEFEKMIKEGEFLEYNIYGKNYYGTPKQYVIDNINAGKNVILEIDVNGGLNVRKIFPDATLIYILPPDAKTLYSRLRNRNTESEEVILTRMNEALKETGYAFSYDKTLVNDNIETCFLKLHSYIEQIREEKASLNNFLDDFKKDLKTILEGENNQCFTPVTKK